MPPTFLRPNGVFIGAEGGGFLFGTDSVVLAMN